MDPVLEPLPEKVEPPKHSSSNFKIVTAATVLLFLLIILGATILIQNTQEKKTASFVKKLIPQITPTPTPYPFRELTIPYLREKTYESILTVQEPINEHSSYTSYLSSFMSDGFKINGLLTKPNGQMPANGWPAIIFIHGYIPPQIYQTTQHYTDYVDYLAKNGFVVFKIDLRGHGNSEGEPSGAYYSTEYIIDTLNAYNALEKTDFVNPKAIGLWGHSMAGNVTLRSLAVKQTIPAAVVWAGAVYSYVDFHEYGISDSSYQPPDTNSERVRKREQLRKLYGDPTPDSEFWQQVAPTTYVKDLKGALEIHHAVDDDVVSIEYSRNLKKFLNSSSVPYELFEYSSGGHNISGVSFTQAMQRTVDFYKKYLN